MADPCICRTENGRRWTNAGCKTHGAHSAVEDTPTEQEQLDRLMGRDQ